MADDGEHALAAAHWLIEAQRVSGGGGFAHSYHLLQGWQPPYPETSGYIVPTLHRLARQSGRAMFAASAASAAAWLLGVQNADGSFNDLEGRRQAFDTGQILIGFNFLAAEEPDQAIRAAMTRAAKWLCRVQEADGSYVAAAYNARPHAYYSRVGAALATAGRLLGDEAIREAGIRNLRWCLAQQEPNGFFRHLSFDVEPPFLHTMIYVIEGLLDGHAELGDETLFAAALRFAEKLLAISQSRDSILRSQYRADYGVANGEKCLTGLAQWAGVCLRFAAAPGKSAWREEAGKTIDYLKAQQIFCRDPRLHGGLLGSDLLRGRYMSLAIPNWGQKFFIDALLARAPPP
jgi:hypothetical protein